MLWDFNSSKFPFPCFSPISVKRSETGMNPPLCCIVIIVTMFLSTTQLKSSALTDLDTHFSQSSLLGLGLNFCTATLFVDVLP